MAALVLHKHRENKNLAEPLVFVALLPASLHLELLQTAIFEHLLRPALQPDPALRPELLDA